jgi:amino acid permease
MAAKISGYLLVVVVLHFYATKGDNTNDNLITARVEVSVVLIYFKQCLNINAYSYLFW